MEENLCDTCNMPLECGAYSTDIELCNDGIVEIVVKCKKYIKNTKHNQLNGGK